MFRSLLIVGALLSTGPEGTAAEPGERPVTADGCDSLPQCLARVRAADSGVLRGGNHLYRDIVRFGAPAVDALVPMLRDPDLNVRERAGYLLAQFPSIDRRHFPALVEAWRHGDTINHQGRGNGWLPRAIAATGTDEALRLLWADYERDPEQSRNSQTFFALAWGFPEQVRPLLLARIAACRDSDGAGISDGNYRGPCAGIYSLLQEYRPRFPAWSIPAILDLAAHARSDTVRAGAEDTLARFSNPAALAPLQRRLASFPRGPEARQRGWEVSRLIMQIVRYGAAARASGPAIIPYLDAAYDENLRADAALALGQIGAQSSVAALLAIAPDLADDWRLAYNVTESLGRLRANEARPLLERLARTYWHRGVRHNAARALNAISGGPFADPARPGDGAPYPPPRDESGEEYMYFGGLRFADDDVSATCRPAEHRRLDQNPVGRLASAARGVVAIDVQDIGAAGAALRARIPVEFAQGDVVFALPVRSGTLVGLYGGEFGGGLVLLPDHGPPRHLTGEPVAFAWQAGGRLYVAAGLAHLVLDTGHLYVVDPARLRIERHVRLPASPRHLYATAEGAAVIDTRAGQMAVRPDGQLVDVERLDGCMAG